MSTKRMLFLLSLPLVVLAVGASLLAWWSHRAMPAIGLEGGRLRPCPSTSNCVSSEPGAPKHAVVAPFAFTHDPAAAWARARAAVIAVGGRVERETGDYLWATFRTPVLRFVDDMELRLDRAGGVIHLRSASRVGRNDLGQNRRRVEAVRAQFMMSVP